MVATSSKILRSIPPAMASSVGIENTVRIEIS
jgi:hypothetical protein